MVRKCMCFAMGAKQGLIPWIINPESWPENVNLTPLFGTIIARVRGHIGRDECEIAYVSRWVRTCIYFRRTRPNTVDRTLRNSTEYCGLYPWCFGGNIGRVCGDIWRVCGNAFLCLLLASVLHHKCVVVCCSVLQCASHCTLQHTASQCNSLCYKRKRVRWISLIEWHKYK